MTRFLQKCLLLATLTSTSGMALAVIPLGTPLSIELGPTLGTTLPLGLGGIAAVTALSLIIGIQLLKRRDK